jgi:hypothetical protein
MSGVIQQGEKRAVVSAIGAAFGRASGRRRIPPPRSRPNGQSLAEFGLVLPLLLVLLVTIADFARIYAAAIVVEAAARNAAEIAAQEYVANPPGPLNAPAPDPADPNYYAALHDLAARAACAEARSLPNTDYSSGTCEPWPAIRVCVHDMASGAGSSANKCGQPIEPGFDASIPAECPETNAAWTNETSGGRRFVEVRVCYRFTSLLNLSIVPLGTYYIERTRIFTIPCYFALGTDECG